MFCLRIWILPLFFLSSASPLYLIFFLSATYVLQRPCVYCSLLLAILVLALFDFRKNWFDAPSVTSGLQNSLNTTNHTQKANSTFFESLATLDTALAGTAKAAADLATGEFRRRSEEKARISVLGFEWMKGSIWRKGIKVPCFNAVIRL